MSARIFCKHGWRYDTDCRLEKTAQGAEINIAPPLPPLERYSREPGQCRHCGPV